MGHCFSSGAPAGILARIFQIERTDIPALCTRKTLADRPFLSVCLSSAALSALLLASGPAKADSVLWQGTTNSWFSDSNWVWDGHTPTAADTARIDGGTPSPVIAGGAAAAGQLFVGIGAASSLSITAGSLTTGTASLGYNALSSGSVGVNGAGTLWTTTGELYVGNSGVGSIILDGGSTVRAGTYYLGAAAGGSGTITVDGASTLSSSGTLYVGYGGTGTLTVNSGSVQTTAATLGDGVGASGQANLSGTTSSWTNTGTLTVGGAGQGTLTISTGATVSDADGIIGLTSSPQTSSVTVTGPGSQWTNSGTLYVGVGATAGLDVTAGGAVTSGSAVIARLAGSTGTATVTGSGSSWSTGAISIGGDSTAAAPGGTGNLKILSGGSVTSSSANLGDVAGATGNVTVDGGSSSWTVSGRIGVGTSGTGNLDITNGAHVSSAGALVGWNSGSSGVATVDGTGSRWTNTGTLFIGNVGNGTLSISAGGQVTSVDGYVASEAGSVSSAAISGTGSSWAMSGDFFVGHNTGASGSVVISGGATVSNTQGLLGDLTGSHGSMIVTGAGSTWASTGDVNVGRFGTGSLVIADGATVTGDRGYIGNEASGSGTALVAGAGSSWVTTQRLYVGADGNGQLTVTDGGRVAASAIRLAFDPGTTGVVNIGAVEGAAAAAAGVLDTTTLTFGSGNGFLVFNHTSDGYVFAPAMSGPGQIEQLAGTTILTADSSAFTGATAVAGGTLTVNGRLGGTLAVMSGARLTGTGNVGTTSIQAGGMISPGGLGTLAINGNLSQAAGSIYHVEIDPTSSASGRLAVSGRANVSGATLDWTKSSAGALVPGARYTVLTAAGGVIGTYVFTGLSLSNFFGLTASYDANDVYLDVAQVRRFAAAAVTPNQSAVADGLQSLGMTNALRLAVGTLSSDGAARVAFDSLSGEAYASVNSLLLEDSRIVRAAALDRIRGAFGGVAAPRMPVMAMAPSAPEPIDAFVSLPRKAPGDPLQLTAWAQGFGNWEHLGGDSNAAALSSSSSGLLAGADVIAMETWRLGLYTGYSRTSFRVADRASSGTSDNYDLGVYGGTQWGAFGLRMGAAYTWHDIDMNRAVSFPGFASAMTSSYGAGTFQTFGELGYRLDIRNVAIEPFAGLAYAHLHSGRFAEAGSTAALTVSSGEIDTVFSTLGARASTDVALGTFSGTVHGSLGWRHAAGIVAPTTTLSFAGSDPFSIAGLPVARDAAVMDAGLDLLLQPNVSVGLAYNGQFAHGAIEQSVKANFAVRF